MNGRIKSAARPYNCAIVEAISLRNAVMRVIDIELPSEISTEKVILTVPTGMSETGKEEDEDAWCDTDEEVMNREEDDDIRWELAEDDATDDVEIVLLLLVLLNEAALELR